MQVVLGVCTEGLLPALLVLQAILQVTSLLKLEYGAWAKASRFTPTLSTSAMFAATTAGSPKPASRAKRRAH